MVPTWIGKPGKMGKHFPVRGKLVDFEQIGKVREFYPKNTGKVFKERPVLQQNFYWQCTSIGIPPGPVYPG